MMTREIELPSNKKFGYFFVSVFLIGAIYCHFHSLDKLSICLVVASVSFLIITVVRPNALLPLNKLWMRFGLLLGIIISPVVLGVIFFGLITPLAILTRAFGRDELRLKLKNGRSHWIHRLESDKQSKFEQQY